MPSFISDLGSYPTFFEMVLNQFANVDKADLVLFNTFYELEKEAVESTVSLSGSHNLIWRIHKVFSFKNLFAVMNFLAGDGLLGKALAIKENWANYVLR